MSAWLPTAVALLAAPAIRLLPPSPSPSPSPATPSPTPSHPLHSLSPAHGSDESRHLSVFFSLSVALALYLLLASLAEHVGGMPALAWLLETRAGRVVVAGGAVCLLLSPAWIAVKQAVREMGVGEGREGKRVEGGRDKGGREEEEGGEGEDESLLGMTVHSTSVRGMGGKGENEAGSSTGEQQSMHDSPPSFMPSPSPPPSAFPYSASPLRKRQQAGASHVGCITGIHSDSTCGDYEHSNAMLTLGVREPVSADMRGGGAEREEWSDGEGHASASEGDQLLLRDVESQLARSSILHPSQSSASKQSTSCTASTLNSSTILPSGAAASSSTVLLGVTSAGFQSANGAPVTLSTPPHIPSLSPSPPFPSLGADHSLWQAVQTPCFWLIYSAMTLASGSGLSTINNLGQMARSLGYQQEQVSGRVGGGVGGCVGCWCACSARRYDS